MNHQRLENVLRASAWAAGIALAALVSGCPSDAETNAPYLIIGPAASQSASKDVGVVLVLQQAGGARVRMRVDDGTLGLTTNEGAGDRSTACVQTVGDDARQYFTVRCKNVDCTLYADLLPQGSIDGSGSDAGLAATCPGAPIANAVVPIGKVTNDAPDGGAGSSSSSSSSASSASSSASSASSSSGSGATGTGGGSPGAGGSGGAGGGS